MVTRWFDSLLFVCLVLIASVQSYPASARPPADPPPIIAVGLLSARDAKPMALVEPFRPGGHLSVAMFSVEGTVTHRVLSGQIFLVLEESGAAVERRSVDDGSVAGDARPFSVQAGSYGRAEAAERFAVEVRDHWPETEVWVAEALLGDGRTAHRVMAGRFPDRNHALAFTTTLAAYGMDGAFVVETGGRNRVLGGAVADGRPLILYNRSIGLVRDLGRVTITGVSPRLEDDGTASPVFRLDRSPYRGTLEVCGGVAGIVAVNRVALEAYLLGVVPCELGPDRFPLLEALKAQAVTARTYALKHAGRHRGEGFDLCDTPHCQVYGGAGREKPLSSEAVRLTAGLAAYYQGELAETLYTSTCGGHTEMSSAVFSGPAEPYLSGVSCSVERGAAELSLPREQIFRDPQVTEAESGADLGLTLGLLTVLDVLHPGELSAANAAGQVTTAEAGQWIGRLAARHFAAGSAPAGSAVPLSGTLQTRGRLALRICRAFGWNERLETLFTEADLQELVGLDEGCGGSERRALAFLLSTDIFIVLPDGRPAAGAIPSRGRFASGLARLAAYLDPRLFVEGVITGAGAGQLTLRFGKEVKPYEIAPPGLRLFERRGEATRPVPVGRFRCGDQVLVHFDQRGRVDLLVRRPAAAGAAADRYSPYAFWSIVVDRETIERLLKENGHQLGRLIDVLPLERGPSGRLSRLRVIGSDGKAVLRGLDIRWNLGTRENLFFIDRVKGDDRSNQSYRFTGRGWGHGVGMCQVGAVGLAEAGATFIEILEHYYPGIRIEPIAGTPLRPE